MEYGSMFKRGLDHVKYNIRCHDRAEAGVDSEVVTLAVSDGMGSYSYPDLGAMFATRFIREKAFAFHYLLGGMYQGKDDRTMWSDGPNRSSGYDEFRNNVIQYIIRMGCNLRTYAEDIGVDPEEMHATLSFAIIGPEKYMAVSIGDSPIFIQYQNGTFRLVDGDRGNYADNQTTSCFAIEEDGSGIGITAGYTNELVSILIASDGCFKKEDVMKISIMPKWFDRMATKVATERATIDALVKAGYDDCAVAYYCA